MKKAYQQYESGLITLNEFTKIVLKYDAIHNAKARVAKCEAEITSMRELIAEIEEELREYLYS